MLKRTVGILFLVIGATVALHTIIEPVYHTSTDAQPYSPAWDVLNPLMALAVVFGIAYAALRKRVVDTDDEQLVTRRYLAANTLFYGFLFVGILFFWSWANYRSPHFTALGPDAASVVWGIVDASLPLLCGAMGVALIRARGT